MYVAQFNTTRLVTYVGGAELFELNFLGGSQVVTLFYLFFHLVYLCLHQPIPRPVTGPAYRWH